jgi:hypothetical protein
VKKRPGVPCGKPKLRARRLAGIQVSAGVARTMLPLKLLRSGRFLPLFTVPFPGAFNDNAVKSAFILRATFRLAGKMGWNADVTTQIIGGKISRGPASGKA